MPQAVFMNRIQNEPIPREAVRQLMAHYHEKACLSVHFTRTDQATLLVRSFNPGAGGQARRNLFSMTWRPQHRAFMCRLYALKPGFDHGQCGVRDMQVVKDPLQHQFLFDPAQGGADQCQGNTRGLLELIDYAIQRWN